MAIREWTIETDTVRTVRLKHGYWSGRVPLTVDGETVFTRPAKLFDLVPDRCKSGYPPSASSA